MSVADPADIGVMSVEECQRLGPPLRRDLEVLDYEIRRLVARARADARLSCEDEALFVKASTTVMLSIAAELMARAAEDGRLRFDAGAFSDCAGSAAKWARARRLRYLVAVEA